MITYKFRFYPTKEQQEKLWRDANACNRLYNYFLEQKINLYRTNSQSISKFDQIKQIQELKLREDWESLQNIPAQTLQQVPIRLDKTYKSFFKRGYGFPKFRSCKKFFGILFPQLNGESKRLCQGYFRTKRYGKLKFKPHQKIQGKTKQLFITSQNNKWFICVVTDHIKEKQNNNKIIALDLGITNLYATNKGEIFKNKSHSKYFDKQIAKLQQRRSKCKKDSRKYKFLTKVIQRLYGEKSRKTLDFLHKVSKNLSNRFDTIIIEDLKLKQMSESNRIGLNRELRNSQLAKFISLLEYKTNRVIKVNPRNTSKICSNCNQIHNMPLKERVMDCNCGLVLDRDINAAKNIFCLGQALLHKSSVFNYC